MSGGTFDYKQYTISNIADQIEDTFLRDGKYTTDDYNAERDWYGNFPKKEADYFSRATSEQRELLLKEIKTLVIDLHKCALRVKHLDWFLAGDTGIESYIESLKRDNLI